MKPSKTHLPIDSVYPLMGINTREPSTMGDPRYSPDAKNVTFIKGVLARRKGYLDLTGSESAGASIEGMALGLFEFEDLDGDRKLLLITTARQYRFDTSIGWVDITQRNDIGEVVQWTGTDIDYLSYAEGMDFSGKWLFITNGQDPPLRWDGVSDRFEPIPVNLVGFNSCKTLTVYSNRLIMGGLTFNGSELPQSYMWSVAGDFTEWSGEGSGASLIADLSGEIKALVPLGNRVLVYSPTTIANMVYVGGDLIFSTEMLVRDTTLVHPRTIVNVGPYHMFMGRENFYIFDGVRSPQPVGDLISRQLRDELDLLNPEECFGYHDSIKRRVYWRVRRFDGSSFYVLEYDINSIDNYVWTIHEFTNDIHVMGSWSRHSDVLWSTVQGTWDENWWVWGQGSVREGFPILVIGSSNGVYFCDETVHSDNLGAFTSYWDSKDLTVPQIYKSVFGRWLEIELEVRGNSVEIQYSTDASSTFSSLGTIQSNDWARHRVYCDVVSEQFRVRLVSTDYFEFRWLRVWFKPGGTR